MMTCPNEELLATLTTWDLTKKSFRELLKHILDNVQDLDGAEDDFYVCYYLNLNRNGM